MNWWDPVLAVCAVLGLAGGVVGFFRSRSAGKDAKAAQAAAATALERSTLAQEEAAKALTAIAKSTEHTPEFEWRVRQVSEHGWMLYAEGDDYPRQAEIRQVGNFPIFIDDGGPRDLLPGDNLTFILSPRLGIPDRPTLEVSWTTADGESRSQTIRLPR